MRLYFLVFLFSISSQAEYRAFLLKISSTDPKIQDFRLVPSSLDPEQYPAYYPIKPNEQVTYVQTWRCPGRTNELEKICDNPRQPAAAAKPIPPSTDSTTPPPTETPPANPWSVVCPEKGQIKPEKPLILIHCDHGKWNGLDPKIKFARNFWLAIAAC